MQEELKKYIRSIKDFPVKGIMFRDITTLLKESEAVNKTLKYLLTFTNGIKIDKVVGIESRGFIFGSLLAQKLDVGFILARKPGKLPAETESETYQLEYGEDKIEIHNVLEQNLIGVLKYGNSALEALEINEEDVIGYKPFGEYEFIVDGKRLYCMKSNDIVIKYERQGNETEYNPSWAQSS